MSQFQNKIEKLKPYIIGIRFIELSTIIDVVFKEGWVPLTNNKILAKKSGDVNVNYYMVYSETDTITLDDLLDYVEASINVNIEREKKLELFKQKVKDMEELFKKTSLNELEGMKFNLEGDVFSPDLFNIPFSTDIPESIEQKVEEKMVAKPEEIDEFQEKEIPYEDPKKMVEMMKEKNEKLNIKMKTMDFDLPPKPDEKIVVEEFREVASICKCGPNESCEVCLDY